LKKLKQLLAVIITLILFFPSIFTLKPAAADLSDNHSPITINGDLQFTTGNGVVSGSGTKVDPYVIENWIISNDSSMGILISNTNAFFVIRNCTVYGSNSCGIRLNNVVNGRVENNNVFNCSQYGIYLNYVSNSAFANNTISSCIYGIYIYYVSNNALTGNTVFKCFYGIYLYPSSSGSVLTENNVFNCSQYGIYLNYVSNNAFANNTISNCSNTGIYLYYSSNNTVVGNIISNCTKYGIYLYVSDKNTLSNNSFISCGLGVSDSYNNVVFSNVVNGFPLIYLDGVSNQTIGNSNAGQVILVNCTNTVVRNLQLSSFCFGIMLIDTSNSTIVNNTCACNNFYGINLERSSGNFFTGNTVFNCSFGINLHDASNNTFTNNTISNCSNTGIYLDESPNNIFTGNAVSNCTQYCIYLYISSSGNVLTDNTVFSCPQRGIYLYYASNNTVVGNTVSNCTNIGIYLFGCDHSTLDDNSVFNCAIGIDVGDWSYNNILTSNIILNCSSGIRSSYSGNNAFANNTISKCSGTGIWIDVITEPGNIVANNTVSRCSNGIRLINSFSSSNVLTGNNVFNCDLGFYVLGQSDYIVENTVFNCNSGIYLYGASNYTLSDNIISNCPSGIIFSSSINNTFVKNTVSNCSNTIFNFYYGSSNNWIYLNNFIKVTSNPIQQTANIWNSPTPLTYTFNASTAIGFLGNYWSDYTGLDKNNDGIGDSPYESMDNYPLMQTINKYAIVPSSSEVKMNEVASTNATLTETINVQTATLQSLITGDLAGSVNFTDLKIVQITSGSFTGEGFSNGTYSAIIEGIQYQGVLQGIVFKIPEENKTSLKGTLSGGLQGILEGFLGESVNGSNIFDNFVANCTISHIGSSLVYAILNFDGKLNYKSSVAYPSTALYVIQTQIHGQSSGYYYGPLTVSTTHVSINSSANPYYGQGFSVLSYITDFGSGEGWMYDSIVSSDVFRLKGFFTDPLSGIVSGELNKLGLSRTLSLNIENIKIGLPPKTDLEVNIWGPTRISPGQTINYIIEYRNVGLKASNNALVFAYLDNSLKYISASSEAAYDEFYNSVEWNLTLPPQTSGYLTITTQVQGGLPQGTLLSNFAYIEEVESPYSYIEAASLEYSNQSLQTERNIDLAVNGIHCVPGSKEWADFAKFTNLFHTQWLPVYYGYTELEGSSAGAKLKTLLDAVQVEFATSGGPKLVKDLIDNFMSTLTEPLSPAAQMIVQGILGLATENLDKNILPTDYNGLNQPLLNGHSYNNLYGFSGGTRTLLTAIENNGVTCENLILISPMSGIQELGAYKKEIEEIVKAGKVKNIYIYQSDSDNLISKLSWLFQAKFGLDDAEWLNENHVIVNSPTLPDGTTIQNIAKINQLNHGELFAFIKFRGNPPASGSSSTIVVAKDPNVIYGPNGYVGEEQQLNYKVEFENEGEGIAFGVYFTDVLPESLDESTLQIGPVYSTADNTTIIAPAGTYDSSTRTITWFAGEVGPGAGGYANISVNVRNDVPKYTEIINYGTVYFPSVPEVTPTNAIVSVVGVPNIAVTRLISGYILPDGANQTIVVEVENKGYYPETFRLSFFANATLIGMQNVTLLGKTNSTVNLLWDRSKFNLGTYEIRADILPVIGEIETGDNSGQFTLVNDYAPWSLEGVRTWYWTNNTSIGTIARGDVDGDGKEEIVTSGEYFDGTRDIAQLCVWDGATLALENVKTWYWTSNTTINSVVLSDVDSDGQVEVVTGGYYYDGTRKAAQLVVWNGADLSLQNVKTWNWTGDTVITSVAISDVDGDGQVEIVTGGQYNDGARNVAELCVWNGHTLTLENAKTWYWNSNTIVNSIVTGDLDSDGQIEIVTGGYYFDGTRNIAQLVEWNGANLTVDRLKCWYWTGNTVINSVVVGDADGDTQVEVVTGGYYNDGARNIAQLVEWDGASLAVDRLTTWYWMNDTAIDSVAIGDANHDGKIEVVTGGQFNDGTRDVAQLVVWNGSTLEVSKFKVWYWKDSTSINSVNINDVNGDLLNEIMTGGAYNDGTHLNSQLIIWKIN
jgi:uncharacterized repeat protein (TIGR01451 family)